MSEQQVLVTGGSNGIGRAVVQALCSAGHRVALTYRSDSASADAVVKQCSGLATAHHLDLASRSAPKELIDRLEQDGPVVGLVNNAGMQSSSLLAMTSDTNWDQMIDINLSGAFRCCRAVLPFMVRRRGGAIVNISSLGAERGIAGQAGYAASKAGLLAMTRVLAREMGRRGIRVNSVIPGFVETGLTAALPESARATLRAAECLPAGTTANSVADAVAFLLSDRASSITGESLHVDAGASC